jgi:hypothetical protein
MVAKWDTPKKNKDGCTFVSINIEKQKKNGSQMGHTKKTQRCSLKKTII